MMGQLELDMQVPLQDLQTRRYWENRDPGVWEPVTVRVRYGPGGGDQAVVLPFVTTGKAAPRNVMVERADGTRDARPVRLLRVKRPILRRPPP